EGRSVKCVRCQEVWFATPSTPVSAADEDVASAAAASAQYRRAGPAAGYEPEPPADDIAARDGVSGIDPNLAASAVDRQHVEYDAPPPLGADPQVDIDDVSGLVAHEAPPLAPEAEAATIPAAHTPGEDIETIAARRARRAQAKREGAWLRQSLA